MKLKTIFIGVSLIAVSFTSSAVDGYKNVKFGSGLDTLKAAKLCAWRHFDENHEKGIDSYYCDNFNFSGVKTVAMSIFIKNSFERFSIVINDNINVSALLSSLQQKYGKPSSSFTSEEFDSFQAHGGSLTVKFDNDTVMLGMNHDPETKAYATQLVYSSPSYFEKLKEQQQKNMKDDL